MSSTSRPATAKESFPVENGPTMTMKQSSAGPLAVAKVAISIWSTVRQRTPPSPNKVEHIRLITIAASHYCEKARWVLDMLEDDGTSPYYYTEDGHPPGLHSYEPLKVSKGESSITPMVVFSKSTGSDEDQEVLWESSKIISRFMPSLYHTAIKDDIMAVEADLGKRLGPALRCTAYYYILNDLKKYQKGAVELAADPRKMSNIESTLWENFLPNGLANGMQKAIGINDDTNEASRKELRVIFQEYSERLERNGGKYLMDTNDKSYGFTAADLTLAALSYPFLRPKEMSFWLVDEKAIPPEVTELSDELRATKAGQHVLRMYKEHRPTDQDGLAVMKNADRNRTFWQWMFGTK